MYHNSRVRVLISTSVSAWVEKKAPNDRKKWPRVPAQVKDSDEIGAATVHIGGANIYEELRVLLSILAERTSVGNYACSSHSRHSEV